MASVFKDQSSAEKASSLDTPQIVDTQKEQKKKKKKEGKSRAFSGGSRSRLPLVADILLIVFIVGAVVGAFFGLRALKNAFTPSAEAKEVPVRSMWSSRAWAMLRGL